MSLSRVLLMPAIAVLLVAETSCGSSRARADVSVRLDAYFSDLHDRGLFDGAVVVGNAHEITWEKGFGYANVDRNILFSVDTPSDGGSLAKTFTAALVLQLASEGRLDLDAPVQRLLPELPYADVTLRQLLSHSSGIPVLDYDYFDPFIPPGVIRTSEGLLAVIAEQKPQLLWAPGTKFEYSSFGYDLAALAAARATGMSFGELLSEYFFVRDHITSAFLRPGPFEKFPGVRTLGYRRTGGKLERNEVFDMEAFHGGSNIYISARDLHRWNTTFLDQSQPGQRGGSLVSTFAVVGNAQSALTLGSWYRDDRGSAFWYSGHLQGFHSEVFRDVVSGRSIVYVSNNTLDPWLQKGLLLAVRGILAGHGPGRFALPPVSSVRKDERPALTGEWAIDGGERLTFEYPDGVLRLVRRGVSYRVVQVAQAAFYVPGVDWMIGFQRDARGQLERIYISSALDERWGTRNRAR